MTFAMTSAGRRRLANIAIIAITTRSSINVKAEAEERWIGKRIRMERKVFNLFIPSDDSPTNPLVVEAWFSFMRVPKPTKPAALTMTGFN